MPLRCGPTCASGAPPTSRPRWRWPPDGARRGRWRGGIGATVMHGHWVIPGGVTAAAAAPALPLVISLHGSDVYIAETLAPARFAARRAFRRAGFVTACSDDLADRAIALGADRSRLETVPYGVDVDRFRPNAASRAARRRELSVGDRVPLLFAAGRLVRKKGFEYLIDALAERAGGGPRDRRRRHARRRAARACPRARRRGTHPVSGQPAAGSGRRVPRRRRRRLRPVREGRQRQRRRASERRPRGAGVAARRS